MTTITRAALRAFHATAAMLVAGVLVFSPFTYSVRADEPAAPEAPAADLPADGGSETGTGSEGPDVQPQVQNNFAPLSTDVTVDTGVTSDLQNAIDAGSTGVNIIVSGSYTGNVTVSQGVNLIASSTGASIIGQVTITSNNASITGFDITNPTGSFGISINAVSSVTVANNMVHHVGSSLASGSAQGIYYTGSAMPVSGISITGNQVHDIGSLTLVKDSSGSSAKGIYVGHTGAGNSTITSLQISNNQISNVFASTDTFAAGGRGAYGILVNYQGATTATISGNTITTLEGLWAHGIGLEKNTPSTTLSGNSISGLTDHKGGVDAHAVFFESNPGMTTVSVNGSTLGAVSDVAVNKAWAGYSANPVVSAHGHNYIFGVNAFGTIQAGVNAASAGGTVEVAAGTYGEDIVVNKAITLKGAGIDQTTIVGQKGGAADTVQIGGGATVQDFTITRDGNTVAEWNDPTLNNQGVNFLQSPTSNSTLKDSKITGNRNGVYMNTSQGNTLTGNIITANRTGIQFAGNISNLSATENEITDNFTVGVLFNLVSGTPTSGTNVKVNQNTITGNWYGAIVSRSGAVGAFDVTNNYYGHSVVTTTTANSTEPGYAAQIPVQFGGTATAPATAQPDIAGDGQPFLTYAPWIGSEDGDEVVAPVDMATTTTTMSENGDTLSVEVAAGTVITGDENWDGDIEAALTAVAVEAVELDNIDITGFENIVPTAAIQIGTNDNSLLLSNAARIVLGGQAGKLVGWTLESDGDNFHAITTVCAADDQAAVDAQLGEGEDCTITSGGDLVVWTKHFTTFVSYTADATRSGRGRSGGSARATVGTVASASTGGQVLGASTFNFAANLSYGSMAAGVTELQQILITAGYLVIPAPTGWFGPLTKAAVMKYQAANAIPSTGFVGPLTRASLNAGVAQ